MAIPQTYPSPGETAVATYSFTDISEGTGVVKFYGFATKTSGAQTYHLSSNLLESSKGNVASDYTAESKSAANLGDAAFTKNSVEWDFDLAPFNLPKIVTGTANIVMSQAAIETDASDAQGYFRLNLAKWDGTTETIIGTTDTDIIIGTPAGGITDKLTTSVPITLTKTHFKKGEQLRLNIQAWMLHVTGGNNTFMHFPHSPNNVDTTNFTAATNQTKLEVWIPFDLDL